jgi:hypothetical protein
MRNVDTLSTNAERQARWRNARADTEERVEVWLPKEAAVVLRDLAEKRGVSLKAIAAQYIERGLARAKGLRR